MKFILILLGLLFLAMPRLFWRQNPTWYNAGLVQLIFPQKFDIIMRGIGLASLTIGLLQLTGLIR